MATALTTDVRMEAPAEQELVIRSVALRRGLPQGAALSPWGVVVCLSTFLVSGLSFWFSERVDESGISKLQFNMSYIDHHDVF